jgi:Ca-activated chloride channel family protein
MSFLAPLAFLGALLSIPIILLYMLRLRRREVTVSSTFLWQQILRDREANTPWQRLRRNLLLFLQLLILALLVLALARPFMIVPAVGTGQIALLLDASASMNATDTGQGTRLDEARQRALEMVDTLSAGDTMTVIRVADTAEVLVSYTDDRAALRAAIRGAQPSHASANWNAALTLAAAGALGVQDFNAVLISDGGVGDAARLPAIPGTLQYIPIGQSGDNVAITALATRALPGETPQLFAQVTNYGDQDANVIFDLRVDGELFTAEPVTIPAHGSLPITSHALPDNFSTLQAGLTMPAASTIADYLPDDNTAWTVAAGTGARRAVLVSEGNLFVEQALRSMPGLTAFQSNPEAGLPGGEFDLYIFDGWLPPTLPDGDLLIINPPGSTTLFTVGAVLERTDQADDPTANLRVDTGDPRMTFVDFSTVNLRAFRQVSAPWADTLIEADGGPLLLAGETDGRQVAILTFDVRDSDLPLQITWPILMSSLVEWFTPQNVVSAAEALHVGDSLALNPQAGATSLRVTLPDGSSTEFPVQGQVIFTNTELPGQYNVEVLQNGSVVQTAAFAVNLFDAGESDIAPQPAITLGGTTITQADEEEIGQREFWPLLALAALLLLLIEWYAYHRRLRAPTVFKPLVRKVG